MKSVDLRVLADGAVVRTDVCIVGSGPAGIVLAQEVADGATDIVVLESGGRAQSAGADALDAVTNVGAPRLPEQRMARNRELGGSTATWWGRAATFADIDFRARAWVPGSGWPIRQEEIAAFLPRAAARLGVGVPTSTAALGLLGGRLPVPDGAPFAPFAWTYSRTADSSEQVLRVADVATAADVPGTRLFVNATVTHLDTDPDTRRVRAVEVRAPDGGIRHVEARTVVLCAGGIENARLLLASNRIAAAGLGNGHDLVGRYLMDHPRGPVAAYRPEDFAAVQRLLGSFRADTPIGQVRVVPGVVLDPAVQEREQLLHAALWVEGGFADDDPLVAMKRLTRLTSPRADVVNLVRGAPLVAETLVRTRLRNRSAVRLRDHQLVHAIVEQQPDQDSRITLDTITDAYGVPRARIDWRVGEAESRTVRRAAGLFADLSTRLGLPRPDLDEAVTADAGPLPLLDAAHPTGTTRMAASPEHGVVDTDLRVHGMDNLYVLGSSVFPTAGHANPTQMITAFAVRLGDHLKRTESPVDAVTVSPAALDEPSAPGPTASADSASAQDGAGSRPVVLLTGANGTVGRRMLPRLLAAGYAVRALTSKSPAPRATDHVEWRIHDLRRANLDFRDDVRGCAGVIHLAVEQRETEDMIRVNAEATAALAAAAEAEGVRFFCYTSSISVYGSSRTAVVDESAPLLTAERDIADEYWVRPALREYGRSKLLGERAITAGAATVEYVVFRPTVIVDEYSVRDSLGMGMVSRAAAWRQRTQAISVHDVVGAIAWALDRSIARPAAEPGVTVYNLSDELEPQTYGDLFVAADVAAGVETRRLPPIPRGVGDLLKWVQGGRRLPIRRPMGSTSFPATKLYAAGYRHRHGLGEVIAAAVAPDSAER